MDEILNFKAKKIKVSLDDPFSNDKLMRKPEVENLSRLLRNISSPIVLSVNAPWGAGKTTFLEMLHADLLSKGCKAIYFSAWEADFANDPLLAFLGEMNQGLESYFNDNAESRQAWEKARRFGAHILKKGIPALVRIGTAGVIDTSEMVGGESSKLMEGLSKDLVEEYSRGKSAIASFKENVVKALENKEGETNKLYIFVDELDRCRPTYSVELLERVKHLLDVEGLVFVLALDKQQLAHSVRAIYGAEFDALGYLRRFIDLEYNLRRAELDKFIDQLFETFNFNMFFDARTKYPSLKYEPEHLKNVFKMLAKSNRLSLREVEQLFSKVNLVILSTQENTHVYPALLAFLLFAKEYHQNIYKNYIQEKSTPEEIIELLYTMLPDRERFESFECILIEAFLIAAKINHYESNEGDSLAKHEKIIADDENSNKSINYSVRVLEIARQPVDIGGHVLLSSLVERIEMSEQFNLEDDEIA